MAVHKKYECRKYIVKHAYCHCAANEYVYSKILKALGLQTPNVKLFRLSNPFDETLFKTEYVAGIEYLDVSERRLRKETVLAADNAEDYYSFLTLEHLLRDVDGIELVLAGGGYIYRIDMADSFTVADYMLIAAGLDKTDKREFNARVLEQIGDLRKLDDYMKFLVERIGGDKADALYKPLHDIQKIQKSYINEFLETLRYFYPNCVCDYYSKYISTIQETAKKYTGMFTRAKSSLISKEQKTG